MAITIKDVAKTVGVATSTVSRTLQNSPSISEKTKQNVRQVKDELGYRPNLTARGLASKVKNRTSNYLLCGSFGIMSS